MAKMAQRAQLQPTDAPQGRSWLRRACYVLLAVVLLAAVIVGSVAWYGADQAIHPKQNSYTWKLSDFPNLKAEPVTVRTTDGVSLAGRFFPGGSKATIVLSHGYGGDQDQMIPYADFLNRAGYSVLTYDMRQRGQSGGDAVTFGAAEQNDLVSVVDYLSARPDVDPNRIGALGISMGGATTVLAAAKDPRIKVVVEDSGYSDVANVIATSFESFVPIPAFPFAPVTVKIVEWRTGYKVNDIRPVDVVSRISPRPIFIIHGTADKDVRPPNGQRLFDAALNPRQIWWAQGAHHVEARALYPAEYAQRVVQFFNQWLKT